MCASCLACALANPTQGKSKELLYNFSIEAPFLVLHINGYQAGKELGFEGSSHYLVACCGMSTFSMMELIMTADATIYTLAIIKIMLQFGFCYACILNKGSKFYGACRKTLDLLKVSPHVLSGGNHNSMILKHLNCYLNSGLHIMTNEHDSTCIALEAILLLIYAWNLCPVSGTDISQSMVAISRKFAFPINFSTGKHAELYSRPGTIESYSRELAIRLSSCREIADLLVREHRCWHRNLVNSRWRDPRIFSVGNIVFARQAMHLNTKCSHVYKLMHPFTGPWRVVRALPGAPYELEFSHNTKQKDKKHASDLCPYPAKLIPFEPLDGADNRYGQLYKSIGLPPYKEVGIKAFTPPQPLQAAAHFATTGNFRDFHLPMLSELNDEFNLFPWKDEAKWWRYFSSDAINDEPVMYTGLPPTEVARAIPHLIPLISALITSIINSVDKLFFVSHLLSNPSACEWHLVRIALSNSTLILPSCLQDGCFLFKFFTLHYDNICFNATNQRYWLQYHPAGDITTPTSSSTTLSILPLDIQSPC